MACLHCSSSNSSSPALSPSSLQKLKFVNRRQQLASIEDSREHRLTLLDWTAQLTASSNNLVRKLNSRNSSTSNLYQILGLFFVFEGVLITAVAQANAIKCHNSWFIFTLSIIACVATFFACIQKLREIAEAERIYLEEKALCSSLHSSIEQLKDSGSEFDLEKGQPNLRHTYTDRADRSSKSPKFPVRLCSFCKTWVCSYAGAVFLVLLAVSGVTLAGVRLIVCAR